MQRNGSCEGGRKKFVHGRYAGAVTISEWSERATSAESVRKAIATQASTASRRAQASPGSRRAQASPGSRRAQARGMTHQPAPPQSTGLAPFGVARSRRSAKKSVKKYMLRSPKRKLREITLCDPRNAFPRLAPRASWISVSLGATSKLAPRCLLVCYAQQSAGRKPAR
jgi:hypothetical protein